MGKKETIRKEEETIMLGKEKMNVRMVKQIHE